MTVILILLGVLIGLFLSIRIYFVSRKSGNMTSQSHAILSGALILGTGVMLISYFILKGEAWSEDKRVEFYQIGTISIMTGFVIFGLRLLLNGRKQKSILTQILGSGWIVASIVIGISAYNFGSGLNEGWSVEKRAKIMAKCDPTTTNCQCFLKTTINSFKSVEDYTSTLSNESENQKRIDGYYDIIDKDCACGQVGDVEEIDLPF